MLWYCLMAGGICQLHTTGKFGARFGASRLRLIFIPSAIPRDNVRWQLSAIVRQLVGSYPLSIFLS